MGEVKGGSSGEANVHPVCSSLSLSGLVRFQVGCVMETPMASSSPCLRGTAFSCQPFATLCALPFSGACSPAASASWWQAACQLGKPACLTFMWSAVMHLHAQGHAKEMYKWYLPAAT